MKGLTREQDASLLFNQNAVLFRQSASEFRSETFSRFVDTFLQVVPYFGESELHIRQAERCEAFGIQKQRVAFSKERFVRLNNQGIEATEKLLPIVKQLRKDFSEISVQAGKKINEVDVSPYFAELRELLVDTEVKRSDIEEINKELTDLEKFYKKSGFEALPDYLEERTKLLIKMRKSPGRGAEKNAAPWKVIAVVAILVVLGLAFVIHCGIFGCDVSSRNSYIAAMITVLLLIWC